MTGCLAQHRDYEPNLAAVLAELRAGQSVNLINSYLLNPQSAACIKIATDASLQQMVAPAALVVLSPLLVGALLGVDALAGLLAGAISSSIQLAISASNRSSSLPDCLPLSLALALRRAKQALLRWQWRGVGQRQKVHREGLRLAAGELPEPQPQLNSRSDSDHPVTASAANRPVTADARLMRVASLRCATQTIRTSSSRTHRPVQCRPDGGRCLAASMDAGGQSFECCRPRCAVLSIDGKDGVAYGGPQAHLFVVGIGRGLSSTRRLSSATPSATPSRTRVGRSA